MPLTLTITEGVLTTAASQQALVRITDSFLKWHGLSGNKVLTPNVIGAVHTIPAGLTTAGGQPTTIAVVEWRTPSFTFPTAEVKQGHMAEAAQIIHDLSGGKQPKERIWGSVVHTVDGTWIVAGQALTNAQLAEAIGQG